MWLGNRFEADINERIGEVRERIERVEHTVKEANRNSVVYARGAGIECMGVSEIVSMILQHLDLEIEFTPGKMISSKIELIKKKPNG